MNIIAGCAALVLGAVVLNAADPEAEIDNGQVRARLYLPDAEKGYYRATRFDWSGAIASLEYKGHTYFGVWFPKYDPKIHDSITGPVEEYRTGESALGYEEAGPGGTFIRIGVGLLRRPAEEPHFQQFRTYEIADPGKWTVSRTRHAVEFVHELADPSSGYAYVYRKTVRLGKNAPRMTIEHSLRNTGKRAIETNVYNHNFFVIDAQPTGPDFTVTFPFDLKAKEDFRGPGEVRGKQVVFLKELEARQSVRGELAGSGAGALGRGGRQQHQQSVSGELAGFGASARDFDFRVENRKTRAGVHVTGDQPLWKVYFWSIRTVVCPEAYVNMKIEPGAEFHWTLTYDFYTF